MLLLCSKSTSEVRKIKKASKNQGLFEKLRFQSRSMCAFLCTHNTGEILLKFELKFFSKFYSNAKDIVCEYACKSR
jgi:hypothetical protein